MAAWFLPAAACLTGVAGLFVWLVGIEIQWPSGKAFGPVTAGVLVAAAGTLLLPAGAWGARFAAWVTLLSGVAYFLSPDWSAGLSAKAAWASTLLGLALVFHTYRQPLWAARCAFGVGIYAAFHTMAHVWPSGGLYWRPGIALPGSLGLLALAWAVAQRDWAALRRQSSALVGVLLAVLSVGVWQNLRSEEDLRLRRLREISAEAARIMPNSAMPEVALGFGLLAAALAALSVEMARRARTREQEARRAEELKTRFLANVSHELRTPMNGVLGMTDLMLATSTTSEQRQCLDAIRHSAGTLMALLNDVVDLSKIEAGRMTMECIPFDPRRELADTLALLQSEIAAAGLTLHVDDARLPGCVEGDPFRFRQIVTNLVGNAIKFTERGGIRVEACTEPAGVAGRQRLRVTVTDSGIGIPREAQAALFERFTQADASMTRRHGGAGLGLAISRQLARLMGGELDLLRSEEGGGSTFWFTMDVKPVEAMAAAGPAPRSETLAAAHPAEFPLRVLLVEDNAINRRIAESVLRRAGFNVDMAVNGREAVEAVSRAEDYALVLMDVQMPEMDGLEAAAAIRHLEQSVGRGRLPIVAMTANAMNGDRERCLAAGMDDYLSKPASAQAVESKVRYWAAAGAAARV